MAFKFFSVYLDFSQSVIGLNMDIITRRDVFVSTKKAGWGAVKDFLILYYVHLNEPFCKGTWTENFNLFIIFYFHQESRLEEARFLLLMLSEELGPLPDTWGLPPSTRKGRQHDCHLD
jgi:hypothetical protein